MKKIVLIDPTYNPRNIPPNLGLGKIEAVLKGQAVDVVVEDFVLDHSQNMSFAAFSYEEDRFVSRAVEASKGADAVYISGSHGMELKPYAMFPRIAKISEAIKKSNRNVPIIFGGALATYYTEILKIPRNTFKEFGIDVVVSGQEVNAADHILQASGVDKSRGLIIVRKQDLEAKGPNEFPYWDAWDLSKYPQYISLMMQTGCPHQCSFCFEGKVYDPKASKSSVDDIIGSVRKVRERHTVNSVMVEDSIALSFPWFQQLSASLAAENLSWSIYARATEILKKKDLLDEAVRNGCRSAIVGIESLNDSDLQATEKKVSARQNIEALMVAQEKGLAIQGCFILGFPTDTLTECLERVHAAQKFNLSTYRWHIMQPDWADLPQDMMGVEGFKITDHFKTQVSLPDSCLLELLDNPSPALVYDEHVLMRAISANVDDIPSLSAFGYKGKSNFRDLFQAVAPIIRSADRPTNEDEMYADLFSPYSQMRNDIL